MIMSVQKIIHFKSDGYRLTGTLHLPDAGPSPLVIGCHGLLADRKSPKQIALADTLNRNGIAYLRFDHRGCGESEGTFNGADLLPGRCRDLESAILAMQVHPSVSLVLGLFGSSFGGTVVIVTAAERKVPALVTYAAPVNSQSITDSAAADIKTRNISYLDRLSHFEFDIRTQLNALHDILVVHGQNDEVVPLDHAHQIFRSASHPKELLVLPGGDHRMSALHHQAAFADACTSWFKDRAPGANHMPA